LSLFLFCLSSSFVSLSFDSVFLTYVFLSLSLFLSQLCLLSLSQFCLSLSLVFIPDVVGKRSAEFCKKAQKVPARSPGPLVSNRSPKCRSRLRLPVATRSSNYPAIAIGSSETGNARIIGFNYSEGLTCSKIIRSIRTV